MTTTLNIVPSALPNTSLERLKRAGAEGIEAEKKRLRKATQEFESFFTYYMLKNMRKAVPKDTSAGEATFAGSMGKDMFTDLFDMEISRHITHGNSRSISAMLYSSLEKLIDARVARPGTDPEFRPLDIPVQKGGLQIKRPPADIPRDGNNPIHIPKAQIGFPVSQGTASFHRNSILDRYGRYIDQAAAETNLDSALIASVIEVESHGDPRAVSHSGAKGLMQLTDSTAREMGVSDVFNPQANIRGGSRYLRKMLDRYGDMKLALAAYNAGPGNVDRHGGVPPFKETRDYITRITDHLAAHATQLSDADTKVQNQQSR